MQQMALTVGVPALSAKILFEPAVEAALTVPSSWVPSSWPGPPNVAIVKIVEARAATVASRPVVQ